MKRSSKLAETYSATLPLPRRVEVRGQGALSQPRIAAHSCLPSAGVRGAILYFQLAAAAAISSFIGDASLAPLKRFVRNCRD